MNLVGLFTQAAATLNAEGNWLEPIAPDELQPKNLHAAQLNRRTKAPSRTVATPSR